MPPRLMRLAAGCVAAVLVVGAACSGGQGDDRAAPESTVPSAGDRGGADAAGAPTTAVPGVGSGASGAGTPAPDSNSTLDTGTAGTATTASTVTPGNKPVALRADLTGEAGVPDPGIPGGTGVATARITGMQICYTLNAAIAQKPLLAHIHEGGAGEAGDVVINLEVVFERTPSGFVAEKCLNKDPALLAGIVANPAGYYVNVHTSEHPRGALRGQLQPSP